MSSQISGGAITIAVLLVATTCLASAATKEKHLSSVLVVGSVFCDTCHRQEFHKGSYFIEGAPVAVECGTEKEGTGFRIEANTNEHGQFQVELPAWVLHPEKNLKRCSATLLQKDQGPCRVASMANASSFTLKSKKDGIHTYSAGFLTYRPQNIPPSCSVADPNSMSNDIEVPRRSELESSKQLGLPPFLSPLLSSPPSLPLPSPSLPLPQIPSLPLPPIPILTPPSTSPGFGLPPLPFVQPPPASLIPPIGTPPKPLQPPSGLPLIPLLPPIPLIPPIPLVPDLPPIPLVPNLPPIPLIPPAQHTLKDHSTQP